MPILHPSRPAEPACRRDALHHPLLADGSLGVRAEAACSIAVRDWLPVRGRALAASPSGAATVEVGFGDPLPLPGSPRAFELCSVRGWIEEGPLVRLGTPDGGVTAIVELRERHSVVRLTEGATRAGLTPELSACLTGCAALLLGRLGRAWLHAAAVLPPAGGAWLLLGGSGCGKSSTCATLAQSGWDYLADDQAVLHVDRFGTLQVEGWARSFKLDRGFRRGTITGVRRPEKLENIGPGRHRWGAPLAGLIFLSLAPGPATGVEGVAPSAALGGLLRQTPWLLADPESAPGLLRLLERAAAYPAFAVSLGIDCYGNSDQLTPIFSSLVRRTFP